MYVDLPLLQVSCAAAYSVLPPYWQGNDLVALYNHVVGCSQCFLVSSCTLIDTYYVGALQAFGRSKSHDEELRRLKAWLRLSKLAYLPRRVDCRMLDRQLPSRISEVAASPAHGSCGLVLTGW